MDPANLQLQLQNLGPWAPLPFVALFGPVWGSVWNLAGATLGATLAFLIARYVASDWVAHRSRGRLKGLIDGVEAEGWRFIAFVRLVPVFPFNLLNYALGLTRIRLSHYVLASLIAMIPGTIAYTWLGHAGREVAAGSETAVRNLLLALGLLAVVAFLPRLVRRIRRAAPRWIDVHEVRAALDRGQPPVVIDVRAPDEYSGPLGHVPASFNIPLADLPARMPELESSKQRRIAIVCRTDKRSLKAAELLIEARFVDVAIVRGGMEQWNREGFAITREPTA